MITLLSTGQAGKRLGISSRRVLALIKEGRLPAIQTACGWVVNAADLALVAHRPTGRPRGGGGTRQGSEADASDP